MKKVLALIIGSVMVMSLAFSGCGNAPQKSTPITSSGSGSAIVDNAIAKSKKDNLVIAIAGDIKAIGYAQNGRMVSSLCAPTLFYCVENKAGGYEYVLENSVVESAEWSSDSTHLVITLRKDVPMHDGTTLSGEDVKYSIETQIKRGGAAAGKNIDVDKITVTNDYTVDVPFKSASVANWNDVGAFMVFSKKAEQAVANYDQFTQSDAFASYGPYQISEWVAGDHVSMKKFDGYFRGNDSTINNINIRRIDESTVAMMELQTGGVDVILYPSHSDIEDTKAGKYENIKYSTAAGLYQQLIVFNLDAGSACANPLVRKAICYAIDRKAMWEGAFESSGTLADTFASKTQEFMKPQEEAYPQDLEKAKELFKEAGIKEGDTLRVCVDNDAYRSTAVEMFKNTMAQIGIKVEIKTGDNASYLQEVISTVDWDLEFGKSGMMGSVAYWLSTQWPVFHHGPTASEDFSEYYKLSDEILATFDDSKREALTQEFGDKWVNEWVFTYPIRQDEYANLVNAKLEGFTRWGDQLNLVGAYFTE